MAVISLVSALLCIPFVSVILGHLARGEVRKSNGTVSGGGLALAGLIIGYLQIAALVVMSATGVGASFLLSNMDKTFESGKEEVARTWVHNTGQTYVEVYFVRAGYYPKNLNDLTSRKPGIEPVVRKSSELVDPWGNPYQYRYPGEQNPDAFDLWTVTPDGRTIGNWD